MEPTRIKICGITNEDDAFEATRLKVDYVGLIFYPPSPRYLEPSRAHEILQAMRTQAGPDAPRAVGVFVDEEPRLIDAACEEAGIDIIQFSGDEPPETVAGVRIARRWRGLSLATLDRLGRYEVDAYLCDTHAPKEKGGTGRSYDYERLRPVIDSHRMIIAGGLTPETVGAVVSSLRPWGVDVSSALEAAPGRKDHERMRAFVASVRAADGQRPDA